MIFTVFRARSVRAAGIALACSALTSCEVLEDPDLWAGVADGLGAASSAYAAGSGSSGYSSPGYSSSGSSGYSSSGSHSGGYSSGYSSGSSSTDDYDDSDDDTAEEGSDTALSAQRRSMYEAEIDAIDADE